MVNQRYDLATCNCTHAVVNVGEAASVDVPCMGINDVVAAAPKFAETMMETLDNPVGIVEEFVDNLSGHTGQQLPSFFACPLLLYVNLSYLNFVWGAEE